MGARQKVAAMPVTKPAARIVEISLEALTIGDDVRIDDDPEALAELARSIEQVGVLQAITVRPLGHELFEVAAGRRRLAASRMAGLERIPCIIRELTDDEAFDIALTENIHRRRLSPIEEGLAYARLRDKEKLNQEQIARRVGRSTYLVSVLLRVIAMPAGIRDKVHRGEMSYATAIDQFGRKNKPRGGGHDQINAPTRGLTGDDTELVSHWRRRHDRLLASVHAVMKEIRLYGREPLPLLDRVVKLDREPLPEAHR